LVSLPYATKIGPGLYIGHFGGIRVSADATIGTMANISQGVRIEEAAKGSVIVNEGVTIGEMCSIAENVTIGISGRGEKRVAPLVGDRV
jgi:serine O-acetyltransferase